MEEDPRHDGRYPSDLRPIIFDVDFAPQALGSVLVSFGATRVLCTATVDPSVPAWMRRQNVAGGWMTAEYGMLPASTQERKQRDISRGKADGRTIEIQRLIGRALRAVFDLQKFPGKTLWLDCDVIQADGGTRTASITGAYVAAKIAMERLRSVGKLEADPFNDSVAAISAGIVHERPLLDLNYVEDKAASVDANLVMTGAGSLVEVQSSGEGATFSREELDALLDLSAAGIRTITELQKAAVAKALA